MSDIELSSLYNIIKTITKTYKSWCVTTDITQGLSFLLPTADPKNTHTKILSGEAGLTEVMVNYPAMLTINDENKVNIFKYTEYPWLTDKLITVPDTVHADTDGRILFYSTCTSSFAGIVPGNYLCWGGRGSYKYKKRNYFPLYNSLNKYTPVQTEAGRNYKISSCYDGGYTINMPTAPALQII